MAKCFLCAGIYLFFECPGCDDTHQVVVNQPGRWTWNGSLGAPTIRASILVRSRLYGPDKLPFRRYEGPYPCESTPLVCHSFVTDGRIEFLTDCTHALAGQTVDLPDWPE